MKTATRDDPWNIARAHGLHFCGDMDPFAHGGFLFTAEPSNYAYGYADAFRIDPMEHVPLATVTRVAVLVDDKRIYRALAFCNAYNAYASETDPATKRAIAIEALIHAGEYEPSDELDGPRTYVIGSRPDAQTRRDIEAVGAAITGRLGSQRTETALLRSLCRELMEDNR